MFLIPSARKVKIVYIKRKIAFYFLNYSIQNVCHDYHANLCHNLHELFGLPRGVLTLDYVVHASIIRISVSIDVYCSTCLFVLWNKTIVTQCTHSNFVKWHTTYASIHTHKYLYCQLNWILNCT